MRNIFFACVIGCLGGGAATAQTACDDAWSAFVTLFPDDATPPPDSGTIAQDWFRFRSAAADFSMVADLVKSARPNEVAVGDDDAKFVAQALVLTDRLVACYPPHAGSVPEHFQLAQQFEADYPVQMRNRLNQIFAVALQ